MLVFSGASIHSGWRAVPKAGEAEVTSLAPRCGDHTHARTQQLALAGGRANPSGGKEIRPSQQLRGVFARVGLPMEKPHRATDSDLTAML